VSWGMDPGAWGPGALRSLCETVMHLFKCAPAGAPVDAQAEYSFLFLCRCQREVTTTRNRFHVHTHFLGHTPTANHTAGASCRTRQVYAASWVKLAAPFWEPKAYPKTGPRICFPTVWRHLLGTNSGYQKRTHNLDREGELLRRALWTNTV